MQTERVQRLAIDLCCGMRFLHRRGAASLLIAGHMSVKLSEDRLLVNRFGTSFETVECEDLVVIDHEGNVVEGHGRVNQTIRLHGHIHKLDPSIEVAGHTHIDSANTFGALGIEPEVYDQESCVLAGAVRILDKRHTALDTGPEIAEAFAADPNVAVVYAPNHGPFARGSSVAECVIHLLVFDHLCRRNLAVITAARAAGVTPSTISDEAAATIRTQQRNLDGINLVWKDIIRRLHVTDPDLVALRTKAFSNEE